MFNAIAHSDYSLIGMRIQVAIYANRMEIQSPGMLPFGMTLDDLQAGLLSFRIRVFQRRRRPMSPKCPPQPAPTMVSCSAVDQFDEERLKAVGRTVVNSPVFAPGLQEDEDVQMALRGVADAVRIATGAWAG